MTLFYAYGSGTTLSISKEDLKFERVEIACANKNNTNLSVMSMRDFNVKVDSFCLTSFLGGVDDLSTFLNEESGTCDWITHLRFDKCNWVSDCYTDLSFYNHLYQLAGGSIISLEFKYCGKTDLDFIKNFTTLERLCITGNSRIVDISALEPKYDDSGKCISGFPELEELTIDNSVTDITKIGILNSLKKIIFSGNKINKGIETLVNLTNLEYVDLTNCNSLSQNRKLCKFS